MMGIIEQQAKQIQVMRNCGNCVNGGSNRHGVNSKSRCEDNECENKSNWKWDGGSGE